MNICRFVALVLAPVVLLTASLCPFVNAGNPLPVSSFEIPQGAYDATFVEDQNGVSIIRFSGNYDKDLSPGVHNAAARAVVAKEFYQHHEDNYDFLVVFSSFEYETGDATAFAVKVQNDIQGIGVPLFSNVHLYGSENLQAYIDMAAISRYELNPFDVDAENLNSGFNQVTNVLAHEILHRWSSFPLLEELQGKDNAHWNFYLNTHASVQYGHEWVDNQDGTFTAKAARLFYSPLDLYLMGMIGPDQVPDTFVIEPNSPEFEPSSLPMPGVTVAGGRKNIAIEQFIAANGERIPSAEDAQKTFRIGFIYLIGADEAASSADVSRLANVSRAFSQRFPILTQGKGIAHIYPEETKPFKPGEYGIVDGSGDFINELSILDGLQWLKDQQLPEGSWQDKAETDIRDTTIIYKTLQALDPSFDSASARDWLLNQSVNNLDSMSRRIKALHPDDSLDDITEELANRQNSDGGWGLTSGLSSSALDTALAVSALQLKSSTYSAQISQGLAYIAGKQNPDGGWGFMDASESSIAVSSEILNALEGVNHSMFDNALTWLIAQQNIDHGFGLDESSVNETAQAVLTLYAYRKSADFAIEEAVQYLSGKQLDNGSWDGSVYKTALALQAIQTVSLPNLSIGSFSATTAEPYRDGQRLSLETQIINNSSLETQANVVRFYLGNPQDSGVLFSQVNLPQIPAFSSMTIPVTWDSLGHAGNNELFVVVDAEQAIVERSETDNQRSLSLSVATAPDGVELEINQIDFHVSPDSPSELPASLAFSAIVRNIGTTDAANVRVDLYEGDSTTTGKLLESQMVNVANRSSAGVNFTHWLDKSGITHFTVLVDADNGFSETNESDNAASIQVETTDAIDLEVKAEDISLSDPNVTLAGNADFLTTIRNKGTVTTTSFRVNFEVVTDTGTQLVNSVEVSLKPAEEKQISSTWLADLIGPSSFVVTVDSDNTIAEADESNNVATINFAVDNVVGSNASLNYRDIKFNPNPALEGFPLQISSVVHNNGTNDLNAVEVEVFEGDPAAGVSLGALTIPLIEAGGSRPFNIVVPSVAGYVDRFIYIVIDKNNVLSEVNEADNIAFVELKVDSLPDFSVSSESIKTIPAYPKIGEDIAVSIEVNNSGIQAANGVQVRVYDNDVSQAGQLLLETTINVPGAGSKSIDFIHNFSQNGINHLFVVVNPENQILESRSDNNSAIRSFNIQNDDFYVSGRFLSPDDNGINDQVEYFYTVTPNSDSIVVLDKRDKEVIRFSADQVNLTPGEKGQVSWQGKNVLGGLLADGNYRFAVKTTSGEYYGLTGVILDTNRSALSEAIGTEYALSRNLTCGIGEIIRPFAYYQQSPLLSELSYGPFDENIYFKTYLEPYTDTEGNLRLTNDTVLFPSGVYRAANDASDVFQLADVTQFDTRDLIDLKISADGQRVLLVEYKSISGGYEYTFWTVGSNGEDLRKVTSVMTNYSKRLFNIDFSGEQHFTYIISNGADNSIEFWRNSDAEGAVAELIASHSAGSASSGVIKYALNKAKTEALILLGSQSVYEGGLQYDFRGVSNPPSVLLRLDIQARQFNIVSEGVSDFAWAPVGNSFLMAHEGEVSLMDSQSGTLQEFPFNQAQMSELNNEERQELTTYLAGLFGSASSDVKGRAKELTWSPDGSEFVFAFEDYIETLLKDLNGDCDQGFICLDASDEIKTIALKYQELDGLYLGTISNGSLERVARLTSLNLDVSAQGAQLEGTDKLQKSVNASEAATTKSASSEKTTKLPLDSSGLPVIDWGEYNSLRRLYWLNGAREILISGGDDSESKRQQFGYTPAVNNINLNNPNGNSDVPVSSLHTLLNLDNPADDSVYIYEDKQVLYQQNSFGPGLYPGNTGRFLSFYSQDEADSCPQRNDFKGHRQLQSLLNLTADLKARKSTRLGGILLDGTATDKHFSSYRLDYADVNQKDLWLAIAPPSNIPVIDDRFTTWVPPYIGNFYVRLTVTDLAGNQKQVIKRVSNTDSASISGVYLEPAYFSPNGDGVQDEAQLSFRVLEPVNLTVSIYDQNNGLVRTIESSFDVIGSQQTIQWDGRDQNGLRVPDGEYRVFIQNYEFFTTLDVTSPGIIDKTLNIFQPEVPAKLTESTVVLNTSFESDISDNLGLANVSFEKSINSLDWQDVNGNIEPNDGEYSVELDLQTIAANDVRFVATDYAGNRSVYIVNSALKRQRAHIFRNYNPGNRDEEALSLQIAIANGEEFARYNGFRQNGFGLKDNPILAETEPLVEYADYYTREPNGPRMFQIKNTVAGELKSVVVQYSKDKEIFSSVSTDIFGSECIFDNELKHTLDECRLSLESINNGGINNDFTVLWNPEEFELASAEHWVRIRLENTDGDYTYSDTINFLSAVNLLRFYPNSVEIPKTTSLILDAEVPSLGVLNRSLVGRIEGMPLDNISAVSLWVQSIGTTEDLYYIDENSPIGVKVRDLDIGPDNYFRDNISRFKTAEIDGLKEGFGYQYRYTMRFEFAGWENPLDTIYWETPKRTLDAAAKPVLSQQCDAGPTDLIDIVVNSVSQESVVLLLGTPAENRLELEHVLYNSNLPVESLSYQMETSGLPQGNYPLRVVATNEAGDKEQLDFYVPIVHQVPQIAITYPTETGRVCATQYYDTETEFKNPEDRDRFPLKGVDIQGTVSSDGPWLHYRASSNPGRIRQPRHSNGGYLGSYPRENWNAFELNFIFPDPEDPVIRSENTEIHGNFSTGNKYYFPSDVPALIAPIHVNPLTQQVESSGKILLPLSSDGYVRDTFEIENWSGAKVCLPFEFEVDDRVDNLEVNLLNGVDLAEPDYNKMVFPFFSLAENPAGIDFNYGADEATAVSFEVFSTKYESTGKTVPSENPQGINKCHFFEAIEHCVFNDERVAFPLQKVSYSAGTHTLNWDGTDDGGTSLADGIYHVYVSIEDGCGNLTTKHFFIGIDNTPPELEISYPNQGDDIQVDVQVKGTARDKEDRLASYTVLVSQDGNSHSIGSGAKNVIQDILAGWNTFGLTGDWQIRLDGVDKVGNEASITENFTLPDRVNLISSHTTIDYYVSPNNDGRLDQLIARTAFERPVFADYSIIDPVNQTSWPIVNNKAYGVGYGQAIWNGLDANGNIAADGKYLIQVVARDQSNSSFTQTEVTEFELDNTLPDIVLDQLQEGYIELAGSQFTTGKVTDKNLYDYAFTLFFEGSVSPPRVLASGEGEYTGILFEVPQDLESTEAEYRVQLVANDLAGNRRIVDAKMIIDLVPPTVEITSPQTGLITNSSEPLTVFGTAADTFLKEFQVLFRPVDESTATQILNTSEESVIDGELALWDTAGLADGDYTLIVKAQDKSGLKSSQQVIVTIDNTPPTVAITTPEAQSYITQATQVVGVATDAHFAEYELLFASGNVESNAAFERLLLSAQSVPNGILFNWASLPDDGEYTLKLTAFDQAENQSETLTTLIVDTTPPEPVVLTSAEFDRDSGDVVVNWETSQETDLAGYYLFRNGTQINTDPITQTHYDDSDLPEGEYTYFVKVVDLAGLVSEPSNSEKVLIDLTAPTVRIFKPLNGERVSAIVDIRGTAFSDPDFKAYRVLIGENANSLRLLKESSLPLQAAELAQWNTLTELDNREYIIRLEAEDTSGNLAHDQLTVFVDNTAPSAPIALEVNLQANGVDSDSVWQFSDIAGDLAGFILYRNGKIVNAPDVVVGSLEPYLLSDPQYFDENLPDGSFDYVVYAIDTAGNISEPSNTVSIVVERRAPTAVITNISDGQKFGSSLYILAEVNDEDVANVIIQYRPKQGSNWSDLIDDAAAAYEIDWQADALPDGEYVLRAVATDFGGLTDPNPQELNVIKQDVTPPAAAQNVQTAVDGDEGTITWDANSEADISTYTILRKCPDCDSFIELDTIDASEPTQYLDYQDQGQTGVFQYAVIAEDLLGNRAVSSEEVDAIYFNAMIDAKSHIAYQDLLTSELSINLELEPGATVDLQITAPDTTQSSVVVSLPAGQLNIDQVLSLPVQGVYQVNVQAQLNNGQFKSRQGDMTLIRASRPTAPNNLGASYNAGNDTINLVWDANPIAEHVEGYRLLRNDVLLTEARQLFPSSAMATESNASAANTLPNSNYNNIWWTTVAGASLSHSWSQLELINSIELDWQNYYSKAIGIEVFARVNGEYLKIQTVEYSSGEINRQQVITLEHSIVTDSIQLRFTTWESSYFGGRLQQMRVMADDGFISATNYADRPSDGIYTYKVEAIDYLGVSSEPSAPSTAIPFGDTEPPLPPILSAVAQQQDALLSWNAVDDAVSYKVYRDGNFIAEVSTLEYVDAGLANGSYVYHITALDDVTNESSESNNETVVIETLLPQAPIQLVAEVPNNETIIKLRWQYDLTDPQGGFRLYRSLQADGVFELLLSSQLKESDDTSAELNTDYFYYVVAVDQWGNESEPSNIVTIRLVDTIAPKVPYLFAPTDAFSPLLIKQASSNLLGFSEPNSRVFLYRDNVYEQRETLAMGQHQLSMQPSIPSFVQLIDASRNHSRQQRLAYYQNFDGVYMLGSSTWDRVSDFDSIIFNEGIRDIYWDANQTLIAETYSGRFYYYDVIESKFDEVIVSSTDYTLIDIHYYSAVEKRLVGTFEKADSSMVLVHYQAESNVYTELPANQFYQLDHRARHMLYVPDNAVQPVTELRIYNLDTGVDTIVALPQLAGVAYFNNAVSWSTGGLQLLIDAKDDANNAYPVVYDTVNGQFDLSIQNNVSTEFEQLRWFGDQSVISVQDNALVQYDTLRKNNRVLVSDLTQLTGVDVGGLELLSIDSNGAFLFKNTASNGLLTLLPAGLFQFDSVTLEEGANVFSVVAADVSANISATSDGITLIYQLEDSIDLSLTANLTPQSPVSGLDATIDVNITNIGQLNAPAYALKIWVTHASAPATILYEQIVSGLSAGENSQLSVPWTPEFSGETAVVIQADPEQLIGDVRYSNNSAIIQTTVVDEALPELSLALNPSSQANMEHFSADEALSGEVQVTNYGNTFNGTVQLDIIDMGGYEVTTLGNFSIDELAYVASFTEAYSWNTAATYVGDYQVRARLYSAQSELISTQIRSFSIVNTAQLSIKVSTDQREYLNDDDAQITTVISNQSRGTTVEGKHVKISILDPQNQLIHTQTKALQTLLGNDSATLAYDWNIGKIDPLLYTVRAELMHNDAAMLVDETDITVLQQTGLTGSLQLPNATIASGDLLNVGLVALNVGNIALTNVDLMLELVGSGGAIASQTFNIASLGADAPQNQVERDHQFASNNLLGSYRVVLKAVLNSVDSSQILVLDTESVTILEATPPIVEIVYPGNGQHINNLVKQGQLNASDDSGIRQLEYQLNGNTWAAATADALQSSRYLASLQGLPDGDHELEARAEDVNGYFSGVVRQPFVVDTIAPVISVASVANDNYYNSDVVPELTVSDLHLETVVYTLNGNSYQPDDAITTDGSYTLTIIANDRAGNFSQNETRFVVDKTAPEINILQVDDDEEYRNCVSPVIAVADVNLDATTTLLNGLAYTSGTQICQPGNYVVQVNASDLAGNSSELIVRFDIVDRIIAQSSVAFTSLEKGETQMCSHAITNDSAIAKTDVQLRQRVLLGNQAITTDQFSEDFTAGQVLNKGFTIDTSSFDVALYTCVLEVLDADSWTVLSSANFNVTDPSLSNTIPIAVDDVATAQRGAWKTINVLSNDHDADNDPLTVTVITRPANGNLIRLSDQRFNYFAKFGFLGQDEFTYQIDDGRGGKATAIVTIDVGPSADCSAVPDHATQSSEPVVLTGWAKQESTSAPPRYYIDVIRTDRPDLFASGGSPAIDHPACTLRYTPKAGKKGNAKVYFRVKDAATRGNRYQSLERAFTISVNDLANGQPINLVPILQLLLSEDDE
ncbi:MAG: CARDB domain-containing protein [Arenicella sp.]